MHGLCITNSFQWLQGLSCPQRGLGDLHQPGKLGTIFISPCTYPPPHQSLQFPPVQNFHWMKFHKDQNKVLGFDTQIFPAKSPRWTESSRSWPWCDQITAQPLCWCRGAHTGGEEFTASSQGRSFPGWSGHSTGTRVIQAHHPPGSVQDDEPRS